MFLTFQLISASRSVGRRKRVASPKRKSKTHKTVPVHRLLKKQYQNESFHYRRSVCVERAEPGIRSVPERTPGAAKSSALCPAHHPREDSRRQGVSRQDEGSKKVGFSIGFVLFFAPQLLLLVARPSAEGCGGGLADGQELLPQALHGLRFSGDQSRERVDQAVCCARECKYKFP